MTTQEHKPKRPQFFNGIRVRMPEDYDFNTWGKDFSSYDQDYKLRTDAVWEKQQLKDWFRLTKKIFYFNTRNLKYEFLEPEEAYTLVYEPWAIEDQQFMNWPGYSVTGSTTSFQVGLGPKQRVQNTFNSFYSMPDYYMMCAMRFEKWWKCDVVYGKMRTTAFDRNPKRGLRDLQDHERYPCFRQYYETTYACSDHMIKFLVELAYAKNAYQSFESLHADHELRMFPTTFDSPAAPQKVTYTY